MAIFSARVMMQRAPFSLSVFVKSMPEEEMPDGV